MSGSHTFSKNVWYDLPTKYHTQNDIKHLMLYIRIITLDRKCYYVILKMFVDWVLSHYIQQSRIQSVVKLFKRIMMVF